MAPTSPSTPSEGEIVESDTEKATTSLRSLNGTNVDRKSRIRVSVSRSPSPYRSPRRHQSRTPSRSPYREVRGVKRPRDDDHYVERVRNDSRRSKYRYGDRPQGGRKHPRHTYDELDRAREPGVNTRYEDPRTHARIRDNPSRTWNRSPIRSRPGVHSQGQSGQGDKHGHANMYGWEVRGCKLYEESTSRLSAEQSVSDRSHTPVATAATRREAEHRLNQTQRQVSSKHDMGEYTAENHVEISSDFLESSNLTGVQPVDEATLIEERRKRREAIKAKHGCQKSPMLVQSPALNSQPTKVTSNSSASGHHSQAALSPQKSPLLPGNDNTGQDSPNTFMIVKNADLPDSAAAVGGAAQEDEPSAADYDPTMDMQEDQIRHDKRHREGELAARVCAEAKVVDFDVLRGTAPDQSSNSMDHDVFDMFAEVDELDMFAEVPIAAIGGPKPDFTKIAPVTKAKALDMSMLDDWDDHEGYYKVILGELLDGRYHVQSNLGKGMFSGVVRATDQRTMGLVAIKLIRNNETMKKAGLKEIEILQKLSHHDPEDRKHMIRLERYFEHKGHLCMVFENLSINLREVLKKFGRDVGINLKAVRTYAQHMFLGLSLLRKCNVIHADLKPDNVLVNESRNLLKICDLGSASDASENEITPYLVSRFYRAPEIILGMPYDFGVDIWSVGCTLFELYTGKILFTGRSNNQMLRAIMECRGKFNHKTLRKAQFAGLHFDDLLNFRSVEKDRLSGKDVVRILNFTKPTRDLKTRLLANAKGLDDAELKELNNFVDLLDKCLNLNPEKRCSPTDALRHPFILRMKS